MAKGLYIGNLDGVWCYGDKDNKYAPAGTLNFITTAGEHIFYAQYCKLTPSKGSCNSVNREYGLFYDTTGITLQANWKYRLDNDAWVYMGNIPSNKTFRGAVGNPYVAGHWLYLAVDVVAISGVEEDSGAVCAVFKEIADGCASVAGKFYQIATASQDIPIAKTILTPAFNFVGDILASWQGNFLNVNKWCIELAKKLDAVLDWDSVKDKLDDIFSLTAIYNWYTDRADWLKDALVPYLKPFNDWLAEKDDWLEQRLTQLDLTLPEWLPTSMRDFEQLILSLVPPLPSWLPTSYSSFVALVTDIVDDIFNLPADLDAWLDEKLESLKDKVINWVAEEFFTILDKVFEKEV